MRLVVVAGLLTEPPPPTAGLLPSGVQRDAGRPSAERNAESEEPRTTG